MIQRIQSIFLTLVAILGIIFSIVPILGYELQENIYVMKAYNTLLLSDESVVFKNMGIGFIGGLIILLSIVIIFLFKNRQLQVKLAKLNILLIAVQITALVFYNDAAKEVIGEGVVVSLKFGALLPVLALIFTYLSIHFITKDEQLVRAADRLR